MAQWWGYGGDSGSKRKVYGQLRISIPYHQVIVSVTPVVLISIGIVL